jgi:uncharacterized damage-inducible protein DinB
MPEDLTKARFLAQLRKARGDWTSALARLSQDHLVQPGFCDGWSARDVVAHMAWYDREMIALLERRQLGGSQLWELTPDERNAAIHAQPSEATTGREIQAEEALYMRLEALTEALADSDLNDPSMFPGMPSDWMPWQVLASNTYEHYSDHLPQVEAFLRRPERK